MPDATVSHELEHVDLASCPPDGYVRLRQMPYRELLQRRDGAARLSMEAKEKAEGEESRMLIETMQTWAREFEFRNCIAEHNLTDKEGNALDFNNPLTFHSLNPAVGLEIEKAIDKLNGEAEESKDFTPAVSSLSKDGNEQLNDVTDEN